MFDITIRPVERFPEPAFSQLQRAVFTELQTDSVSYHLALQQEATPPLDAGERQPPVQAPMFRLGAYQGEQLVGWTCGWMERGRVYYMANSGVVTDARRRGVYTRLLVEMQGHAQAMGAVLLRSQHSVLNNPVIIAKLRQGFHISGLTVSAEMGALVEMTRHLHAERQAVFKDRTIPYNGRAS